jgi:hypothetical protein
MFYSTTMKTSLRTIYGNKLMLITRTNNDLQNFTQKTNDRAMMNLTTDHG